LEKLSIEMIKQIIDISEQSYIHLSKKQLLIDQEGKTIGSVPIEDIGILILEHNAITITQAVMIACQKNNIAVVICDNRHLPYSLLLPLTEGNNLHSKVIHQQIAITTPRKKQLWKEIIQEKIKQQSLTLERMKIDGKPLKHMISKVKSGDSENHEAQASQKYWKLLMGESFRRNPDEPGVNSLLNYGYSIIRAMVARAIVSTGLHPALGLFHHNQYNGFALADDLMEPFRPWVDLLVSNMALKQLSLEVNRENKKILLGLLNQSVKYNGKKLPFMVVSHHLAANLKEACCDKSSRLTWPQWSA
jgi:CRISPR-associated protein Cas1|tara:strand:+ start:594 stop:1505 length:912 start_codon:yes stop_codon:yes gene_type:complete